MPRVEACALGLLTFVGTFRDGGAHVDVTVRGQGAAGSRPLCGTLTVSADEWKSLVDATPGGGFERKESS
jgi:hypothetical protein